MSSDRERMLIDAQDHKTSDDAVTRESIGQNIPTDFKVSSMGIEDVDRLVFNLFENIIKHSIPTDETPVLNDGAGITKKVPVIFATGERFALVKRKKPIRDKNGQIILPLISIRRSSITQTNNFGRGVAQDAGGLRIKRRLSSKDPDYQKIINKMQLANQDNVTTNKHFIDRTNNRDASLPGTIASRRLSSNKSTIKPRSFFNEKLGENIFEIIELPFPSLFEMRYEIVYWTQYTQHMNTMLEQLMNAYVGQGNQFFLQSDKGYWVVGYIGDDITPQDNLDDFSGEERLIKQSFELTVPTYLLETKNPGEASGLRRYLSAPQINFFIHTDAIPARIAKNGNFGDISRGTGNIDKFTLSDTELLNKSGNKILTDRFEPLFARIETINPQSGKQVVKFVRIKDRNQRKGETVLDAKSISELERIS